MKAAADRIHYCTADQIVLIQFSSKYSIEKLKGMISIIKRKKRKPFGQDYLNISVKSIFQEVRNESHVRSKYLFLAVNYNNYVKIGAE